MRGRPQRPKAIEVRPSKASCPGLLEETGPAGVICTVMVGLGRLPYNKPSSLKSHMACRVITPVEPWLLRRADNDTS
jgi:hypothetical protein